MKFIQAWRFITLMLASFSLSLSMTHLLELPQRMKFDQQLWVRVTVFENVYRLFGSVGAAFEIIAILTAIVLVFLIHDRRYRDQWEYAHAVNALIKIIGLSFLVISVLVETPKKRANGTI